MWLYLMTLGFLLRLQKNLHSMLKLKIEITRMWRANKVIIIAIIIGALESVPVDLPSYWKSYHYHLH